MVFVTYPRFYLSLMITFEPRFRGMCASRVPGLRCATDPVENVVRCETPSTLTLCLKSQVVLIEDGVGPVGGDRTYRFVSG